MEKEQSTYSLFCRTKDDGEKVYFTLAQEQFQNVRINPKNTTFQIYEINEYGRENLKDERYSGIFKGDILEVKTTNSSNVKFDATLISENLKKDQVRVAIKINRNYFEKDDSESDVEIDNQLTTNNANTFQQQFSSQNVSDESEEQMRERIKNGKNKLEQLVKKCDPILSFRSVALEWDSKFNDLNSLSKEQLEDLDNNLANNRKIFYENVSNRNFYNDLNKFYEIFFGEEQGLYTQAKAELLSSLTSNEFLNFYNSFDDNKPDFENPHCIKVQMVSDNDGTFFFTQRFGKFPTKYFYKQTENKSEFGLERLDDEEENEIKNKFNGDVNNHTFFIMERDVKSAINKENKPNFSYRTIVSKREKDEDNKNFLKQVIQKTIAEKVFSKVENQRQIKKSLEQPIEKNNKQKLKKENSSQVKKSSKSETVVSSETETELESKKKKGNPTKQEKRKKRETKLRNRGIKDGDFDFLNEPNNFKDVKIKKQSNKEEESSEEKSEFETDYSGKSSKDHSSNEETSSTEFIEDEDDEKFSEENKSGVMVNFNSLSGKKLSLDDLRRGLEENYKNQALTTDRVKNSCTVSGDVFKITGENTLEIISKERTPESYKLRIKSIESAFPGSKITFNYVPEEEKIPLDKALEELINEGNKRLESLQAKIEEMKQQNIDTGGNSLAEINNKEKECEELSDQVKILESSRKTIGLASNRNDSADGPEEREETEQAQMPRP